MADRINSATLQVVQSVNTPDYPDPPWKPVDLSQVAGVPPIYWKWDGVNLRPIPMTAGEQATVDANALSAKTAAVLASFQTQSPPGVIVPVVKKSSTTRTGTTVLADDPELSFPVVANGRYVFSFRVFFDTSAAGDFKCTLNGPASPVAVRFMRQAIAAGAAAWSGVGVTTVWGGALAVAGTGTTGGYIEGYGIFENGPNAGNVAFQWAQNTSDVGNTTVLRGSVLQFAKVG